MEEFILWGAATDALPEQVSFLASRVQWPCIHRGTRAMIDRMLTDLGLTGIEYRHWSIEHFRNNHNASQGESPRDPETWVETWEIALVPTRSPPDAILPLLRRLNDRTDIIRTPAHDDTWSGMPPSGAAPYVIVARLYHERLFARMIDAIEELHESGPRRELELADLVDAIKRQPLSSQISVRRRASDALELAIHLGVFDEEQFKTDGCEVAQAVSDLVHEFGGTTTWDERRAVTKT